LEEAHQLGQLAETDSKSSILLEHQAKVVPHMVRASLAMEPRAIVEDQIPQWEVVWRLDSHWP